MGVNPPKKHGSFQVFHIITRCAINDILDASFIWVIADLVKEEEKLPRSNCNIIDMACPCKFCTPTKTAMQIT
jgi:hypothetical protein